MRRAGVLLAACIVTGCAENSPPKSDAARSSATPPPSNAAKAETAAVKVEEEPEVDSGPVEFDPSSPKRTLRWIAAMTELARQPAPNRAKAVEQVKASQKAFANCLKQTVRWKLPVEGVTADGILTFSPVRTAGFADASGSNAKQMALKIRPWNSAGTDSVFACPPQTWLTTLRPGQDAVTVQGMVTGINTTDNFLWYVSLSELQFFPPGTDPSSSLRTGGLTPEKLDTDDVDKAFAWLRRRVFRSLDPFVLAGDRLGLRKSLQSDFRSLAGTKVRWRWPATVPGPSSVALQDHVIPDFEHQTKVAVGLLVKQPKSSDKSGQSAGTRPVDFSKVVLGTSDNKLSNAGVISKIREAKQVTVRGTIAKVDAITDAAFPPRAIEIAVWLDDAQVEP